MQKMFSFIAGAMCGALIGAVAALLLAPMSGKQLQAASRERTNAMLAEVRRTYHEREAKLKAQLASLRGGGALEAPPEEDEGYF